MSTNDGPKEVWNMVSVSRVLSNYHKGTFSHADTLAYLLIAINSVDIDSDIQLLPPDLAKSLRDYVLSIEWPWAEGRGLFLVRSDGLFSLPAKKFEIFRNWFLTHDL